MYKTALVCGVWDKLHEGHKNIIKYSIENSELLKIFVLEINIHDRHEEPFIPYEERKKTVENYVLSLGARDKVQIIGKKDATEVMVLDELRTVDCAFACAKDKNQQILEMIKITQDRVAKLEGPDGRKPFVMEWVDPVKNDEGKIISSSKYRKKSRLEKEKRVNSSGGYGRF